MGGRREEHVPWVWARACRSLLHWGSAEVRGEPHKTYGCGGSPRRMGVPGGGARHSQLLSGSAMRSVLLLPLVLLLAGSPACAVSCCRCCRWCRCPPLLAGRRGGSVLLVQAPPPPPPAHR